MSSTIPVPTAAPADAGLAPSEVTRWHDAALRVQAAILSGADVDTVLRTVAATARELVEGDVATLAVPHVPDQSLVLRATDGHRAEELRGAVFPIEESLSGQVMATRRGVHLTDASTYDNAYQPICELADIGPTLMVPLERQTGPFGTLLVGRRQGRPDFGPTCLQLLCGFAGHVALAVEFCRGQEELRRLASLEETERVGRELHDNVVQRLFATGLMLQGLSSRIAPEAGGHLESVLHQLDGIVRDIRSTVLDPGPR